MESRIIPGNYEHREPNNYHYCLPRYPCRSSRSWEAPRLFQHPSLRTTASCLKRKRDETFLRSTRNLFEHLFPFPPTHRETRPVLAIVELLSDVPISRSTRAPIDTRTFSADTLFSNIGRRSSTTRLRGIRTRRCIGERKYRFLR